MREVIFRVELFGSGRQRPASERVLRLFLEALVAANLAYLQVTPAPGIYQSGVRYRAERPKLRGAPIPEEWLTIPYLLKKGYGDCEDLACWRVAELQRAGVAAQPAFRYRQVGNLSIYHIFVRLPGGKVEDPSRRLGMGAPGSRGVV
jgi:hypothetical protein